MDVSQAFSSDHEERWGGGEESPDMSEQRGAAEGEVLLGSGGQPARAALSRATFAQNCDKFIGVEVAEDIDEPLRRGESIPESPSAGADGTGETSSHPFLQGLSSTAVMVLDAFGDGALDRETSGTGVDSTLLVVLTMSCIGAMRE